MIFAETSSEFWVAIIGAVFIGLTSLLVQLLTIWLSARRATRVVNEVSQKVEKKGEEVKELTANQYESVSRKVENAAAKAEEASFKVDEFKSEVKKTK